MPFDYESLVVILHAIKRVENNKINTNGRITEL